jgi:hypothetical protein
VSRSRLARVSSGPRLKRIRFGSFDRSPRGLLSCAGVASDETVRDDSVGGQSIITAAKHMSASLIFCEVDQFILRGDHNLIRNLGIFSFGNRRRIISAGSQLLPATPMYYHVNEGPGFEGRLFLPGIETSLEESNETDFHEN